MAQKRAFPLLVALCVVALLFIQIASYFNRSISAQEFIDSKVNESVEASERELFEAEIERAISLVRLDQYEAERGFTKKHKLQLLIQEIRVQGFANVLYLQPSNAQEDLKRLLELSKYSKKLRMGKLKADYYSALSSAYRRSENRLMAIEYEQKALTLYNALGEYEYYARMRADLISRNHNRMFSDGKKEEILQLIPKYKEEIEFAEQHSKYALAYNTRHLAQIHRRQTLNYEESLKLFERSLELRQEIGFKPFIPASYSSIGDVYFAMGENTKAIDAYEIARELATEIGFKRYEYYPLIQIGKISASIGNVSDAIELFEKALESATTNEYKAGIEEAQKLIKEYSN